MFVLWTYNATRQPEYLKTTTRETWELDAEAKILNNIVRIETEVDGKGINKILQAIETKGGLPTFFMISNCKII